jgi:hypothetical protein
MKYETAEVANENISNDLDMQGIFFLIKKLLWVLTKTVILWNAFYFQKTIFFVLVKCVLHSEK